MLRRRRAVERAGVRTRRGQVGTLDYKPAYEANEFGSLLLQRLHEAGAEGA